ncbi:MAG: response regulator transcription factor [Flavobacteriales bacterium]|nr:MAG: response regulator transcription factor [Flavobacteriales bacterium]
MKRRKAPPAQASEPSIASAVLLMTEGMRELRRLMQAQGRRNGAAAGLPPGFADLTNRELQVLRAVASDKEPLLDVVADELDIHRRTLGNHIKALCEKLQVKSLRGLVRVAVRAGLC